MRSSTFSSKYRLVINGLTAFLIVSLLYSAFIRFLAHGGTGLNQWQENRIRLQNYSYRLKPARCVFVGSSMASRINETAMNPHDVNLAASGGDSLTGLETILRSPTRPTCVAVEVNATLLRGVDQPLISKLFHPILYPLKRALPLLQETYQPIVLLGSALKNPSQKKGDHVISTFKEVIAFGLEDRKRLFDEQELDQTLLLLRQKLTLLKQQGVRVFLFDLPRYPDLEFTPQNQQVQKKIQEVLASEFERISIHSDTPFQTEDGDHLVESSAIRFTELLTQQLDHALGFK